MKSKKIKLFRKYYDIKDEVKTQYDKWLADGKKYDFLLDFSNFSFNVGGELLFMPSEVWPWNEINFKNARMCNMELCRVTFDRNLNLSGSDFTKSTIKKCVFSKVDLKRSTFNSTRLILIQFIKTDLEESQFKKADIIGAYFSWCSLIGTNFYGADLTGAYFVRAKGDSIFDYSTLKKATFTHGCNFNGASFRHTDLRSGNFRCTKFIKSNFSMANLMGANLERTDLRLAILSDANFNKANLKFSDLRGADLKGAKLCGAKIKDTIITQSQWDMLADLYTKKFMNGFVVKDLDEKKITVDTISY